MHNVKLMPETDQNRLVVRLALLSAAGVLFFVVAIVSLHFLRPDYNPVTRAVSNYAIGAYGWLMVAAFLSLALSLFTLAYGLFRSLAPSFLSRASILMLNIAGVGLIITGFVPGDVNSKYLPTTATALIHWLAAAISFLFIVIAALLLSQDFKYDELWCSFRPTALVLAFSILIAFLVFVLLVFVGWLGIGQRIFISVNLLWLICTAKQLCSVALKKTLG